ncbi:hypothetical protein [Anaerospora sp.]|uniref:hypothetical protein n=1 Tax=Anaerospora sp. TaxID=1960278 RepID=UPI0028A22EF9|nr:hypothetical protein [Anaerospora sp.]
MRLLDNGLDSFRKSILMIQKIDKVDSDAYEFHMKDIVLSLQHSIETLFKYLLTTVHEYFIYEDLSQYCKNLIENKIGNRGKQVAPHTIMFLEVLNRVIILKKLEISKSQYDSIVGLNNLRNAITHHEFDFTDRQAEHFIAKILPFFFDVFERNIPEFKSFCFQNNIQSTVKDFSRNNEVWALDMCTSYIIAIKNSKESIDYYNRNPIEKGTILKELYTNKNKIFEMEDCPVCGNKTFVRYGTTIIYLEEKNYFGRCNYCSFDQTKEMAMFIGLYFGTHNDFIKEFEAFLVKIVSEIFEFDSEELKKHIKQIRKNYAQIEDYVHHAINTLFISEIENLLHHKAGMYFENKIGCDSACGDEMVSTPGNIYYVEYHIDDLSDYDWEVQEFVSKYKSIFSIKEDIICWEYFFKEEYWFVFPFMDINLDENVNGECEMIVTYHLEKNDFGFVE